jgi:pimeloyl-ACP methyl ester carboxylesterase
MPIVQDWVIDIDFAWAQYDAMKVHHGFLGATSLQPLFKRREANLAYFAIIALLNIILSRNLDANRRIIVIGHSLGGAFAVLYAAMLHNMTK